MLIKCEISVLRGEDKVILVIKASTLFILYKMLPYLLSYSKASNSTEDIFTCKEDKPVINLALARIARDK